MQDIISSDRLLSVWIFMYFLVYFFKFAPFNPIILLYIAYTYGVLASFYISFYTHNYHGLILFVLVNTTFKTIPIMLVQHKTICLQDIMFTCFFVVTYVVYMQLIGDDIICLYKDLAMFYVDPMMGRPTSLHNSLIQFVGKNDASL